MNRANYHRWTAAELDTLRRMYPVEPARVIAEQLGMPIKKIYSKAHTLGLNKPGEWMAERSRRLMEDPNHPGRRTWFKAGAEPHNKGKPHPARGRAIETQFKPGMVPHTWRPIGHERVSKEGYLQRKVADTGVTRRDYVPVHHLVWRMHGRDIPPLHALCFADGDKRNFDINNLELVPRAELMRRNSVHRLPKEAALAARSTAVPNRTRRSPNEHEQHGHAAGAPFRRAARRQGRKDRR